MIIMIFTHKFVKYMLYIYIFSYHIIRFVERSNAFLGDFLHSHPSFLPTWTWTCTEPPRTVTTTSHVGTPRGHRQCPAEAKAREGRVDVDAGPHDRGFWSQAWRVGKPSAWEIKGSITRPFKNGLFQPQL